MERDNVKKITISTRRARDFRVLPAEGALGGITPAQMFQINFYIETPNIPADVTHELSEEGKLGRQLQQNMDGGDVVRELQTAILMTVPQAESLARWILSTIDHQSKSSRPAGSSGYVM